MRLLPRALMFVLLLPAVGMAQGGPRLLVGAGASMTRLERLESAPALDGLVLEASGRFAFRALALEVAYRQGALSAEGDEANPEDLVDGEVMLALRALPWLLFRGGPHLRALVTPAGTERWTRWELRVQVDAELVPNAMRADAELITAVAAAVNTSAGGSAHGASVGVTLRVANSPAELRLSYEVDRASTGGATVEFLQAVGLRVTVGRR